MDTHTSFSGLLQRIRLLNAGSRPESTHGSRVWVEGIDGSAGALLGLVKVAPTAVLITTRFLVTHVGYDELKIPVRVTGPACRHVNICAAVDVYELAIEADPVVTQQQGQMSTDERGQGRVITIKAGRSSRR